MFLLPPVPPKVKELLQVCSYIGVFSMQDIEDFSNFILNLIRAFQAMQEGLCSPKRSILLQLEATVDSQIIEQSQDKSYGPKSFQQSLKVSRDKMVGNLPQALVVNLARVAGAARVGNILPLFFQHKLKDR